MVNTKNLLLVLGSILLLFLNQSCTESANEIITPAAAPTTVSSPSGCGDATVVDFLAGQFIDVGDVTISNDEDYLYVHVQTSGDWVLGHTHLYVGAAADIPSTPNGNPKIGNFPYNTAHDPAVTSYMYTLDLADLDPCFIVAFHAEAHLLDADGEIIQSETAWSDGDEITDGGSWATRTDYCAQSCCVTEAQEYVLYGGQTIEVGVLSVVNDEDNLYVTYTTTGCWELGETHVYVGDAANIPTAGNGAPIPGQFPYSEEHSAGTTTYTYTIPLAGLPACYAVAAHAAVACTSGDDDGQTETAWSFGTEFPNTPRWGWYSEYCTQEVCDGDDDGGDDGDGDGGNDDDDNGGGGILQ